MALCLCRWNRACFAGSGMLHKPALLLDIATFAEGFLASQISLACRIHLEILFFFFFHSFYYILFY
jgi:hypothetical protein